MTYREWRTAYDARNGLSAADVEPEAVKAARRDAWVDYLNDRHDVACSVYLLAQGLPSYPWTRRGTPGERRAVGARVRELSLAVNRGALIDLRDEGDAAAVAFFQRFPVKQEVRP